MLAVFATEDDGSDRDDIENNQEITYTSSGYSMALVPVGQQYSTPMEAEPLQRPTQDGASGALVLHERQRRRKKRRAVAKRDGVRLFKENKKGKTSAVQPVPGAGMSKKDRLVAKYSLAGLLAMQKRYGRLEGSYKEALEEKLAAARKHMGKVLAMQAGHEPSSAEAPSVYPTARKASTPAGGYVRHRLYVEQQGSPAKPPVHPEVAAEQEIFPRAPRVKASRAVTAEAERLVDEYHSTELPPTRRKLTRAFAQAILLADKIPEEHHATMWASDDDLHTPADRRTATIRLLVQHWEAPRIREVRTAFTRLEMDICVRPAHRPRGVCEA